MKIIYLASGYAKLQEPGVIYNDLLVPRENRQDMLDVNLDDYDILIATPPCNFYSYARGGKRPSDYALNTAHLLLDIIIKFYYTDKPFIVENVTNKRAMDFIWAMCSDLGLYRFKHARHTYITNIMFDVSAIPQEFDFCKGGKFINTFSDRQGGNQVSAVIDAFIKAAKSILAHKHGEVVKTYKAAELEEAERTCKAAREELKKRLSVFIKT